MLITAIGAARGWLWPLLVLGLVAAAATAVLPALLGRALDEVVAGGPGAADSLAVAASVVGVLAVAAVVEQWLTGAGTARATGSLRSRVGRHLLAVGPTATADRPAGDLVARLVGATATASQGITVVSGLTVGLVPPVVGIIALAVLDPWLAVTFIVGMVALTGSVRTYLRDARQATAGYLEAQGAIATRLVDALTGARTIAAAGTTAREVARVLEPLPWLRAQGEAMWRTLSRLAFQGEPVVRLTQVAVMAVAGARLAGGHLSAGELLAASRYAVMATGIASLADELSALSRARAGAQRVADVLAQPVRGHGHRTLPPGPGRLELAGVVAGPDDAPVLDRLDLVVPGGATVALVGRSGAGKSLLAAVAGRLVDPAAGEVRLDGEALDQLDRRALRRAITYAFERPELPGATVADAIALGPDRPDHAVIERAAAAARAHDFVRRLPDGYDARLDASPLSGGEMQRLGLARAFARDARVLILDDALSSLDTATEAEIAAALTERSGQTRLVVTHRIATAARADLVAWLDHGRIRALGPHEELWPDPAYRAVYHTGPELAVRREGDDPPTGACRELPRRPRPRVPTMADAALSAGRSS